MRIRVVLALRAAALGLVLACANAALGDPGDKAGWSTDADPRKRAFPKFVPENDGPRILMFACLRDAESFAVYSTGFHRRRASDVEITLVNGAATYRVRGDIAPDGLSPEPTFVYETDADGPRLRAIESALMPVLSGAGPIRLTLGSASRELPPTGLKPALDRFAALCFSR